MIFRAREIIERSGHIRIEATIKDPLVADALGGLNDQFARREQLLTYTGRTLVARIEEVQITTRAARSRDVVIEAAGPEPAQATTYSFNGMSRDEMTDLALRVSVLGEPNPLGIMGGQAEISNPLPEVVAAGVSAEALRAVCELVLTEVLVIERGVAHVLRLRLGTSIAGRRVFQLEWLPASHYGEPSLPRMLQGTVAL